MASDFAGAFAALREILRRHTDGMLVHADKPDDFTLTTPAIGPNKKPIWFAAVLWKKSAVTYHLFPLYMSPVLQATIGPELLKRKQGKTCFHFLRPDPQLFAELDSLTKRPRDAFARHGLLEPGPVSAERLETALRAGGVDTAALVRERKTKARQAAAKRAATAGKRRARGGRAQKDR